ncbi:FAD-dependent oxidoreductase [Desulfovibrio sp. TomC]|uniref:FAD-dependent oxidoreductase n=1 Tax=Desulfovibrio sp. TomC TaxID=1562888 RepID=UPI000574E1D4|nr:FAD-dependent oxidoreductase [Desulfovibrio sp. TomC]KHK03285.1 NADH dehydrogenase [Desulfovibrio sp. TomC]
MPQQVVIIGGVALGPKAACRFKRLEPESNVIMLDRSPRISYGGCGIPYYVSGEVSDITGLQSTAFHMVRNPEFFHDVKDVDARNETEVTAIDRAAKTVTAKHLPTGREETIPYDKLVLAMGSRPRKLPIAGLDLAGVHTVDSLEAAESIKAAVAAGGVGSVAIIGSGFIGLEMAVAFADMWGLDVTVIELFDQILPGVTGPALSTMARKHMEEKGVVFHLSEQVARLEGDGKVERVVTDKGVIEADMVIVSVGVVPNSELAKAAGIAVSERGGVLVDEFMRTSDPDIYAGGDCIEVKNLVTGQPMYLPLGSMANRQGRIIGDNLAGASSRFAGVVGSWCVKLFDLGVAGTGLTLAGATRAGYDAVATHITAVDRAHFYPEHGLMSLELVAERGTRRVLGLQGVSVMGDALIGKINTVAAMLPYAPTVSDISNVEVAYSPPFAAAMDILNTVGNAADNILTGQNKGISVTEFAQLWDDAASGIHVIDCRENTQGGPLEDKHPGRWHNIPQGQLRQRLAEVPKDQPVVLMCNTGARSYEALVILTDAGFHQVVSVEGGMAAVKAAGVDV